ncbi:MAG: redoxin domain-containing protein [Planctomycetota bacterium]|jgi:peroxiredoxin Q/BCP
MANNSLMAPGGHLPEMALPCSDGHTRWMSDLLREGPIVLFVLEGVDRQNAADQAVGYEELAEPLLAAGVRAVGLSPDTIADQAAFARANGLTMPLLSDPTGMVCGVFGARNGRGAHRAAFLVDTAGTIRRTLSGLPARRQAAAVLARARTVQWSKQEMSA